MHIGAFNVSDDRTVSNRCRTSFFPIRVLREALPCSHCTWLVIVSYDVNQGVRLVRGKPVSGVTDTVFFKKFHSVILKSIQEVIQFTLVRGVGSQFINLADGCCWD